MKLNSKKTLFGLSGIVSLLVTGFMSMPAAQAHDAWRGHELRHEVRFEHRVAARDYCRDRVCATGIVDKVLSII